MPKKKGTPLLYSNKSQFPYKLPPKHASTQHSKIKILQKFNKNPKTLTTEADSINHFQHYNPKQPINPILNPTPIPKLPKHASTQQPKIQILQTINKTPKTLTNKNPNSNNQFQHYNTTVHSLQPPNIPTIINSN